MRHDEPGNSLRPWTCSGAQGAQCGPGDTVDLYNVTRGFTGVRKRRDRGRGHAHTERGAGGGGTRGNTRASRRGRGALPAGVWGDSLRGLLPHTAGLDPGWARSPSLFSSVGTELRLCLGAPGPAPRGRDSQGKSGINDTHLLTRGFWGSRLSRAPWLGAPCKAALKGSAGATVEVKFSRRRSISRLDGQLLAGFGSCQAAGHRQVPFPCHVTSGQRGIWLRQSNWEGDRGEGQGRGTGDGEREVADSLIISESLGQDHTQRSSRGASCTKRPWTPGPRLSTSLRPHSIWCPCPRLALGASLRDHLTVRLAGPGLSTGLRGPSVPCEVFLTTRFGFLFPAKDASFGLRVTWRTQNHASRPASAPAVT